MSKNIFINTLFFLFLTTAFIPVSCVRHVTNSTELRFGFTSEPLTLDPLNPGNTADGRSLLFNVFEGLVKTDTMGNMLPCLAESWSIEEDSLVYNFSLRKNVFFHDGSLLTSADVKFSLETAAALGFDGLNRIEKITVNENNVTVILKTPDPEFLPYMTIGIVKAGSVDREREINGTGPFYIESYRKQRDLTLKKFENYWQRLLNEPVDIPRLEKVTIMFFADTDALLLALRGGSIDGASITGAHVSQLDPERFDIFHNYSASVQLMALNNAHPPLDDVRVRQAINYGINIQDIIDTAFFGIGKPSSSPVIPGLSVHYENSLNSMYPYDPEKGKSLLAEAGFSSDEQPGFTLEITVPSNYFMHVDTAQVIASQLAETGININIKLVDWPTWLSDVYFNRQYQATIISLDSPVVSARGFLSRYHSLDSSNFINYKNTGYDRVYEASLSETDDEKRSALYREAQRIITSDAAGVYIQDIFYFVGMRSGAYSGILDYPLYVIDFASIYGIEEN